MASNWPPELKDFVARSMAASLPSNKQSLNDEIKALIFRHHAAGTIQTTDWNSIDPLVEFKTLRETAQRQTFSPNVNTLPIQFGGTPLGGLNGNKRKAPAASPSVPTKKQRNAIASSSSPSTIAFPTGYTFATTEEDAARAKRAQRFEREHQIEASRGFGPGPGSEDGFGFVPRTVKGDATGGLGALMGMRGFGAGGRGKSLGSRMGLFEAEIDPNVIDWDKDTVVGTSQNIEKSYLRLTSAPDPTKIRPLPVLRKTLEHLKKRWRTDKDYAYILDQFKSMRQDLTVQRIKNEFTVQVYEIFARMAMEIGDLGEYNQCQSILKQLYEHNIDGHADEFLAYRILYMVYSRNQGELLRTLANIPQHIKTSPDVNFALAVQTALSTGNYHRFFKLYGEAPKMSGYLMDKFVPKERIGALTKMTKAYMNLPLTFIQAELAFDDLTETHDFLETNGIAIYVKPLESEFPKLQIAAATPMGKRGFRPPVVPVIPLEKRLWDCKASQEPCRLAISKFQKVDIKGQI